MASSYQDGCERIEKHRSDDNDRLIVEDLLNELITLTEQKVQDKTEKPVARDEPKLVIPAASASRGGRTFVDDFSSFFYSIKWIEFHGVKTPILLQNENGPCPLISICNCLLLRGHLKLEPVGLELIENDKLIQMLANLLLNEFVPHFMARQSQRSSDEFNLEQNISDALSIFESLQFGLNVNVRFSNCNSFEYTREMDIFDLFSIALYHGWLIDPEQSEFHRYLADKSYNQLAELTCLTPSASSNDDERNYMRLLADSFLESTASQLTYHGLTVLHTTLQPDELAILFRNNHFSTIYKCPQNNTLYTLVTDNGYLNHSNVVWETLEGIDGDGRFCDSHFRDITSEAASVAGSQVNAQYQNDYLLALSLQEDINLNDNAAAQSTSQSNKRDQPQAGELSQPGADQTRDKPVNKPNKSSTKKEKSKEKDKEATVRFLKRTVNSHL